MAIAAVAYAFLVAPRIRSPTVAVVTGLAYGAAVWALMNAVVLPLGRPARKPFGSSHYLVLPVQHALLVGLPIVLMQLNLHCTAGEHG